MLELSSLKVILARSVHLNIRVVAAFTQVIRTSRSSGMVDLRVSTTSRTTQSQLLSPTAQQPSRETHWKIYHRIGRPALKRTSTPQWRLAAFRGVETTCIPQITRLRSEEHLVTVSRGPFVTRSGGSLPQRCALKTFCCSHSHFHTIDSTLLRINFGESSAVSYECVEDLFMLHRCASY